MLKLCRPIAGLIALLLFTALGGAARAAPLRSVAFPGTVDAPLEQLTFFDEVVLDPTRAAAQLVQALRRARVTPVATLPSRPGQQEAPALLADLVQRGYGGFVIDACQDSAGPLGWTDALFTQARQILPRGRLYWRCPYHRPPPRLTEVDGVIVTNLFTDGAADGAAGDRRLSTPELRRQRAGALAASFINKGVAVLAIDDGPRGNRTAARALAAELAAAGIIPFVRLGVGLGVGLVEPVPRRLLALYDSTPQSFLPLTAVHRMAALPLEYYGYALDYWDVRGGLPAGDLTARYAGIVTWFTDNLASAFEYSQWLVRQLDAGMRVAILDRLGATATPALLQRLGVATSRRPLVLPLTIVSKDNLIGYEAPARPLGRNLLALRAVDGTAHITLRDAADTVVTPVITGAWGGLALNPYVLSPGARGSYRWRIDPFRFFASALGLTPAPVPDVTTENGRRLLMVHIDGDSFHGRSTVPDRAYSGEVIRREFLNVFRLPTTVSFVEAEIGGSGLNRRISPTLEGIAREIAALPHVELATHTFSHPFSWPRESGPATPETPVDSLQIPGYSYSARREIRGSVNYLQRRIAPPGKPIKAVLWSGNALPAEDVMAEVAALGLHNVNGFNCDEPSDSPALTQIPSLYRLVGKHLQVYAPAHNENVFIEPFRNGSQLFGFRNVIRMFDFTEAPRRLKPIGLYYHFYSGGSIPAIEALRDVYQWVSRQPSLPIHLSEYSAKVREWPDLQLARRADGIWQVRGARALRTLRIEPSLGWPDLARSANVIGFSDGPGGRFVSLLPADDVVLALAGIPPREPHLSSANARVVSWVREGNVLRFRLTGHLPVEVTIGSCAPEGQRPPPGATMEFDPARRDTRLRFVAADTRDVVLDCGS